MFRKLALAAAAAALICTASLPASANPLSLDPTHYPPQAAVGVGTGLGLGIGASQGIFGGTSMAIVGSSAAASAAFGGGALLGAVVLTDASIQPCKGFQALFNINHLRGIACRDGHAVGYN